MHRFQHVVLLKFPQELDSQEVADMDRQLADWRDVIPGIQSLTWGKDVGGRAKGYQYGLVLLFCDEEAAKAYHPHPVHQYFAHWVHDRLGDVLAFDYPIDSDHEWIG